MGVHMDQRQTGPSFTAIIKDFSEKTTAHGINQIHSAHNHIWRTLWMLLCMASFGMLIFQASTLIITFMNKPVQTTIDVNYSETITFPMVTICNLNIIKQSKMHSAFPDIRQLFMKYKAQTESNNTMNATSLGMDKEKKNLMKGKLSMKDKREPFLSDVEMDPAELVQDEILNILSNQDSKLLIRSGHGFEEMIFRCSWMGFSCNKGDFLKYWRHSWNWRYGNCYTFNSGANTNGSSVPPMTISKPGPMFGLTLDLFINQEEYVGVLSQEAGVKVLLSDQRQIPFPFTHGFTVSPGSSASIGARKIVIERIDPFNNNSCYNGESLEDDSIYNAIKGASYSVQGCMNSCLANKQILMCNCTEGKFRTKSTGKVCFSIKKVACIMDVTRAYENGTLGCSQKCPPACRYQSYRTTISSSQWSDRYQDDFKRLIKKSKRGFSSKMHTDTNEMRKNFLRLKIFFDELNLESITYSESYQIESLLGDIGGQLGLWVGISAITCCEIIKLFLDLSYYLWKKIAKHEEKRAVGDVALT